MNIITENTNILNFNPIKEEELVRISIPKNICSLYRNWTIINNKLYYYKKFNFNELIGEYLAKEIDLNTVHNLIGVKNSKTDLFGLYTLTENFRKNSLKYKKLYEILGSKNKDLNIYDLKPFTDSKEKYNKLKKDLLLLYSLDIYMRQIDRGNINNLLFEVNSKSINLAPIFDYSLSFFDMKTYENLFKNLNLNKKDIYEFCLKYPKFYNMLKFWLDFDIEPVLNKIENEYKIDVNKKLKNHYLKEDIKSKKLIKRIL